MALKRSLVWDYFTGITKDLASCNACGREISTGTGSTSGLSNHLKTHHVEMYHELQEKKLAKASGSDLPTLDAENNIDYDGSSRSADYENKSSSLKRSLVWEYFIDYGQEMAKCKACDMEVQTVSGNTTGLAHHLKKYHTGQYNEMQEKKLAKSSPTSAAPEDKGGNSVDYKVLIFGLFFRTIFGALFLIEIGIELQ